MQFELNQTLIDEIIFYMEDQSGEFVLDAQEGIVINMDDGEADSNDSRYVPLPDWGPSEGFRLMEHFTAGLHNALVREELSAALDRGRGVFRAFKDTLTRYPEAEKLWFGYKDREMKREVISWYNSLREVWGLELIGEEPEDIAGLALEDFRFRQGMTQDSAVAQELHLACLGADDAEKAVNAAVFAGMAEWVFPGDICCVAETAGGEFAGYISAVRSDTALRICAVEVQAEYRGLGLGKALLARLLEQADSEKNSVVIIDLPAGQGHFARALLREHFNPRVQRYCRYSVTS
ncbi:MAG: GNAT family N-acetyltransferase [Treponema sp.]|jgi:ribosomal protein S18 acetylase RimI-like enzyme|nr:GNAT family N-acetyltransferase [Treponema sp.]